MKLKKIFGALTKYGIFILLLILHIKSLHQDINTIADNTDYNIRIWKDALIISAIIGEIGSLLVTDKFNLLTTGKTPSFLEDIQKENSENTAVMYNESLVGSLFCTIITALYMLNIYLQNKQLLIVLNIFLFVLAIGSVLYILAIYLKSKNIKHDSIFSKLSNPVFIPTIIYMIQILITQKTLVKLVYNNIYHAPNDICLILTIIVVLCYFLAAIFGHFSNIYCLISFRFLKKDVDKIKNKIEDMQKKEEKLEIFLRKTTKQVDEKAEQYGFIKKIKLIFSLLFAHIKVYLLNRVYAISYLLLLLDLKTTKVFRTLLKPEQIKINGLKFCWIVSVIELLSLDMLLFIYLESNDPCLKFFELLSTVIIIPILLSWITELKSKNN